MLKPVLLYCGAVFTLAWGIAHLFPTKSIVKGFGDISEDNKRIITMEWIIEGMALIFIGLLVTLVTIVGSASVTAGYVYWLTSVMMVALSILSLFTGAKIDFLPFKLCPVIFTVSALLIFIGSIL